MPIRNSIEKDVKIFIIAHQTTVLNLAVQAKISLCILTDEPSIVAAAIEEFDKVWRGSECGKCQRKNVCPDPIV